MLAGSRREGFGDEAYDFEHDRRGDVVCLMPTRDHNNMVTARVAAAVMFEMIALMVEP